MSSQAHTLADQYYAGRFTIDTLDKGENNTARHRAVDTQFHFMFDDWYRDYYASRGDKVAPLKALVRTAFTLFHETYGYLPKAYKNCAISSGTYAHIDAVAANYHTTDELGRRIGDARHGRTVKDNSQRSLERAERVKHLLLEAFIVAPTMFEGSTRAYNAASGRELTGGLVFKGADYMSFWNMVIDQCEFFVLDDVRLDRPDKERVRAEIEAFQARRIADLPRPLLRTSDWTNSRNSILEMARGNYNRFGLNPVRSDARVDMRFYDEATNRLYPATLLETIKPAVQNILRWVPQGIAAEEACRTVARLFYIHKMRIDPDFNARQTAPLQLEKLDPLIANPSYAEVRELNALIDKIEPFLLTYCPHLIATEGLDPKYAAAREAHPIKPHMIGQESLEWQRANIPLEAVMDLWDLTAPAPLPPENACPVLEKSHGVYSPQRKHHDFDHHPFEVSQGEIWRDQPYTKLSPMYAQLGRAHVGVLEILVQNPDRPEYAGIRYDLKRGEFALDAAAREGLADLVLLPGRLGRKFAAEVREPTLRRALDQLEDARHMVFGSEDKTIPAFGSPIVTEVNDAIRRERPFFAGPGERAPTSDYRLALEMEMLRRNYTRLTFQKNWETSEDNARMMVMATKIEFGKVKRPGGNDTELHVLDEAGTVLPFAERVHLLNTYLSRLKLDERIKRAVQVRDPDVLEEYGIRHISLALARLIDIYDCLKDPDYSDGRFELRRVESLNEGFADGLDTIRPVREAAIKELCEEWCWLWDESDLKDLRQEYRDAWLLVHGRQAQEQGIEPLEDMGTSNPYGPA
ncbi:MAG: hypothetical protein AB7E85_06500 [Pseudobdellovibrionaceae bacterium]